MMTIAQAGMSWPEAAVAVAGTVFVAALSIVLTVQLLGTWRARMSVAREDGYRQLAEQATQAQDRTAHVLERTTAELTALRERTSELERMLKEVA